MVKSQSTLLCLSLGVCIILAFTVFGYAQESLTRGTYGGDNGHGGERFKFPTALILLQTISNVIVSGIILLIKGDKDWSSGASIKDWSIVSSAYLGAHECGYLALAYIPFPLQVVCKSCKAVPVLIGESIIAGKQHKPEKKLQVIIMVLGVVLFTLSGSKTGGGNDDWAVTPEFILGLSLVTGALVCDGIYGPYQNRITAEHGATNFHLMFNMNLYEFFMAVCLCMVTGELTGAIAFVARHPEILQPMAYFCCTITTGSIFIFTMQENFESLAVTLTTTLRKLISVVFSVFWFGHTLHPVQWASAVLVFLAHPLASLIIQLHDKTVGNWTNGIANKLKEKKNDSSNGIRMEMGNKAE